MLYTTIFDIPIIHIQCLIIISGFKSKATRVMYLNNLLIEDGICNGTVGVVTDLDKNIPSVQVAFCIQGTIVHKWIARETSYFYINGQRASRTQFPLQNAFSLTVHKTQSLIFL